MKIRNQVYLISFGSSIIPLILLAVITFNFFKTELKKAEKEKVELVLEQGEVYLNDTFENLNSKMGILANIYETHDAKETQEYIDFFSESTPEVEYFVFGDHTGKLYTGSNFPGSLPEDYDPRIRPWYMGAALSKKEYFISEVFIHASTGKPVITASKKIEVNGEIRGVIVALIKLEILGENLKKFRTKKVTGFIVSDGHGHPLLYVSDKVSIHLDHDEVAAYLDSNDKEHDHGTYLPIEFIEENHSKLMDQGFLEHRHPGGNEIYYPHLIELADITLIGGISEKELLVPVVRMQKIILLISLLTILLSTLVILIFGKRFSDSLLRLSYIIDNIARGDYSRNLLNIDKFINVDSELYLVKEGIKKMQDEIQERENQLKLISEMDSLTKIYNKGAITDIINVEINRSKSFGTIFSLIMFDLDKFKNLNDTYGHLFGDVVLEKVAETVLKELKKGDLFGRYGGEEFLILLPDTNIHGAVAVAQRLRKAIFSLTWEEDTSVSASFGTACFSAPESFEISINIVDGLLYKAKKNGRNQVAYNKPKK